MLDERTRIASARTPIDPTSVVGWGVDANPENDPTYPYRDRSKDDGLAMDWERPPQQQSDVEILRSMEYNHMPAVYGTSTPPSGVSGMVRRAAFRWSESNWLHWLMLMGADRIDVVEGVFQDLARGKIPNIPAEMGARAEWKHNKKGFAIKTAVVLGATAGLLSLMRSSGRSGRSGREEARLGQDASRNDSGEDVWAIAKAQRIAMMTTQEGGRLVSRPMASLAIPEENKIYFVTRLDAKAEEIGGSAPVNLGYSDTHKNTYLSISGTARTSRDREKLRELWSMMTEAWLPEGPDAEDVALITVEPEEAKLWDSTGSMLIYGAKVLKAVATQTPPDGGRVEEVAMGGSGSERGSQSSSTSGSPDSSTARRYDKAMSGTGDAIGASSMGGPAS